jgi:hypothetical protein
LISHFSETQLGCGVRYGVERTLYSLLFISTPYPINLTCFTSSGNYKVVKKC